jgi:putative heme-binding domain-containing protein
LETTWLPSRWIEKGMRWLLIVCCVLASMMPARAQRLRGEEARNPADLPEKNPLNSEADVVLGRQLFMGRCALCHGRDGEGGRGAALNTGQYRHGTSDREMFLTIRNGIANTEMPGTFLTDPEVWRLVTYVKRLGLIQATEEIAPGGAQAGRAIYMNRGCPACHAIDGLGGDTGPDLSSAGARSSLSYLRESIVSPSTYVPLTYRAVTVTTLPGEKIRGIHLNEDDYSIQLRAMDGNPRSFLKSDLKEIQYEKESLMPSYAGLPAAELDNLVAYLSSLRGKR